MIVTVFVARGGLRQQRRGTLTVIPARPCSTFRTFHKHQQLCGGAAVAMVLRYWGEHNVLPQDFASLVDSTRKMTTQRASSPEHGSGSPRGWQAVPADVEATP